MIKLNKNKWLSNLIIEGYLKINLKNYIFLSLFYLKITKCLTNYEEAPKNYIKTARNSLKME